LPGEESAFAHAGAASLTRYVRCDNKKAGGIGDRRQPKAPDFLWGLNQSTLKSCRVSRHRQNSITLVTDNKLTPS
jgi:hypothetical protein